MSNWKGSIALGLLSVPVKINPAARAETISFNQITPCCKARVGEETTCKSCGKTVTRGETLKGYEVEKDKYLIFEKAEIDAIHAEASKVMEINCVVNRSEVDPLLFESSYYVEPELGGRQGYKILVMALEKEDKVAIATITLNQREHKVVLRAYKGVLVFHTMFYADEVRPAPALDLSDIEVNPKMLNLACSLLEASQEPFNHSQYADGYRQSAIDMIEAKANGQPVTIKAAPKAKQPVDIMEALAQSIKAKGGAKPAAPPTKKKGKVA